MNIFFPKNLAFLREQKGLTQTEMAESLNLKRSTYANYEAGITEPKYETLAHIVRFFGIDAGKLLFTVLTEPYYTHYLPVGKPLSISGHKKDVRPKVYEAEGSYGVHTPQVVTIDADGNENIVYVPLKARAGYLAGHGDPEYMQSLPAFKLPGFNNATYRMFEVEGPSMIPTVMHGDRVIGQWLGGFDEIRENRVHIIVTKEGIVIKRLLNRIAQRGKLVLKSDTLTQRKEYPTYEIDPEDVLELWYCRLKLSADFSEPGELYHKVNDLESEMAEIRAILEGLQINDLVAGKKNK